MTIAIICTALLGLLLFVLGFTVSVMRGSTGVNFGYNPDPTNKFYRLVRAHGNTAEYAPMLAVLMLLVGARDPTTWMLWTMMIAILLSPGCLFVPPSTGPIHFASLGHLARI